MNHLVVIDRNHTTSRTTGSIPDRKISLIDKIAVAVEQLQVARHMIELHRQLADIATSLKVLQVL